MIVETLADIGTEIYFLDGIKIAKSKVEKIRIEIYKVKNIIYSITTANGTVDKPEGAIGLTQEGLFNKIKLKENV